MQSIVRWMVILITLLEQFVANEVYAPRTDPVSEQIVDFKHRTKGPVGLLRTSDGAPIEYHDANMAINSNLLRNEYFLDSYTHLFRERIPERVVHARGSGAFGYFELTHDVSHICKASFLKGVGKKTPMAARFSPIAAERGGIDTTRDARGFAVRFYTEEGNFDIVGFNTPMYTYKDPILFPHFVHSQKRNPATNILKDPNMFWDFLTNRPETLHIFMMVFSDRGIPDGYRHMPGFSVHTYQVVNEHGESHFIRFHFTTDQGIKNLRPEEAREITGRDQDYATRDLYNAIAEGNFPSWTVYIQILTIEDIKRMKTDPFDITTIIPEDEFPLHEIGRMVLNRNAVNYFAEIEQLALNPANLVPGILGAPDKVFEARLLSYRDAQNYRLGVNYHKIAVNCPLTSHEYNYNRDGVPPVKDNEKDIPNYYFNSFNGPAPYVDKMKPDILKIVQDPEVNNFEQARDLYENQFSPDERSRLVENLVNSLSLAVRFLQERAVKYFTIIHPDLGRRIEEGLLKNTTNYLYMEPGNNLIYNLNQF